MSVASESLIVQRNYAHFHADPTTIPTSLPYNISAPIKSSPALTTLLVSNLKTILGDDQVLTGLNCTADSFYSSQGRLDPAFADQNTTLIATLQSQYPTATTLEMETYILYHLSEITTSPETRIHTSAVTMIFFNRITNESVTKDRIRELEETVGAPILESLRAFDLDAHVD